MDYSPTDENLQFGIKHMSGSFAFSPLHLYQMEEVTSITVTTRFHSLVLGYTIQNTVSESRTSSFGNNYMPDHWHTLVLLCPITILWHKDHQLHIWKALLLIRPRKKHVALPWMWLFFTYWTRSSWLKLWLWEVTSIIRLPDKTFQHLSLLYCKNLVMLKDSKT